MALIKCDECGNWCSSDNDSCPNCGYPINSSKPHKNNSRQGLYIVLAIFVIAVIAAIFGLLYTDLAKREQQARVQTEMLANELREKKEEDSISALRAREEAIRKAQEDKVELKEQVKPNEEDDNISRLQRFCGQYTFPGYNNNDNWTYEVLPDGRFILITRVIATGEEVRVYKGTIAPISDVAFMVRAKGLSDLCSPSTPICVYRNGQEHVIGHTSRGGTPFYKIVFDVNEGRAYIEGLDSYNSRDISEVEYYRFIH